MNSEGCFFGCRSVKRLFSPRGELLGGSGRFAREFVFAAGGDAAFLAWETIRQGHIRYRLLLFS